MWEYNSTMNNYGTPDALTILPYWTNGCIGSMEGLYYEASATTPFHFIDQSELSLQPSDPMVGLPYASSPERRPRGRAPPDARGEVLHGAQHRSSRPRPTLTPRSSSYPRSGRSTISLQGQYAADPGQRRAILEAVPGANTPRGPPLGGPARSHGRPQQRQPAQMAEASWTWYDEPERVGRLPGRRRADELGPGALGDTNPPVKAEPKTQVSDIVEHNSSISFNVSAASGSRSW